MHLFIVPGVDQFFFHESAGLRLRTTAPSIHHHHTFLLCSTIRHTHIISKSHILRRWRRTQHLHSPSTRYLDADKIPATTFTHSRSFKPRLHFHLYQTEEPPSFGALHASSFTDPVACAMRAKSSTSPWMRTTALRHIHIRRRSGG
jgi:hypothetical protein